MSKTWADLACERAESAAGVETSEPGTCGSGQEDARSETPLAGVVREAAGRFGQRPLYRASMEARAELSQASDAVQLADLKADPDRVLDLARRPGGVNVMSGGSKAFRLSIPSTPLPCPCEHDEDCDVRADLAKTTAQRDEALRMWAEACGERDRAARELAAMRDERDVALQYKPLYDLMFNEASNLRCWLRRILPAAEVVDPNSVAEIRQQQEWDENDMPKLRIDTSDPETRAVWQAVLRARDEVASWPAWKRGDVGSERSRDDLRDLRETLRNLLLAFPELRKSYSTHEQQQALRAAVEMVGGWE